jgi:hypothetical protein
VEQGRSRRSTKPGPSVGDERTGGRLPPINGAGTPPIGPWAPFIEPCNVLLGPPGNGLRTTEQGACGPLGNGLRTTEQGACGPLGNGLRTTKQGACGPLGNGLRTTEQGACGPLGNGLRTTEQGACGPLGNGLRTTDHGPRVRIAGARNHGH